MSNFLSGLTGHSVCIMTLGEFLIKHEQLKAFHSLSLSFSLSHYMESKKFPQHLIGLLVRAMEFMVIFCESCLHTSRRGSWKCYDLDCWTYKETEKDNKLIIGGMFSMLEIVDVVNEIVKLLHLFVMTLKFFTSNHSKTMRGRQTPAKQKPEIFVINALSRPFQLSCAFKSQSFELEIHEQTNQCRNEKQKTRALNGGTLTNCVPAQFMIFLGIVTWKICIREVLAVGAKEVINGCRRWRYF